jgi:hypothetical protein
VTFLKKKFHKIVDMQYLWERKSSERCHVLWAEGHSANPESINDYLFHLSEIMLMVWCSGSCTQEVETQRIMV